MEANFDRVKIVQAEGDEPRYGNQDTDGSRSLRHFIQPARQIGASVRQMLEAAAAERWGVPVTQVRARDHAVRLLDGEGSSASESGQQLGYGELAEAAMAKPVPAFDELTFKMEIYGTRTDVAKTLGMSDNDVRVNVTLLGGGFGRKSKCDFVIEAALIAKEVGAPVKLQWTREDDIRHGFNATTSVERLEAAIDENDKVVGWRHRSVSPTIMSLFAPDPGIASGFEMGMGLVDSPFDVPNLSIETGEEAKAHTRIGWFRSVSNIPHAFAAQSFVAEVAASLGRDPKDMLLELIGPGRKIDPKAANLPEDLWNYGEPYDEFPNDTSRLRHVIELAAEKAKWGQSLPEGEGLGIAAHRSFVSYVASVVRVRIADDGSIQIPEVHTAIDCGYCINPERVHSQIEGAAVMGTTLALHSALIYENGAVKESNFHDYPVARITSHPERVMTHIVEHPFSVHATGVGEPGLPPFAPALANAIFAATGKRMRDLPFGDKIV